MSKDNAAIASRRFQECVTGNAFVLSLSRPMIAALLAFDGAKVYSVHAGRIARNTIYYKTHEKWTPRQRGIISCAFHVAARFPGGPSNSFGGLLRRGLAVMGETPQRCGLGDKTSFHLGYHLTPAGRAVAALLHLAGFSSVKAKAVVEEAADDIFRSYVTSSAFHLSLSRAMIEALLTFDEFRGVKLEGSISAFSDGGFVMASTVCRNFYATAGSLRRRGLLYRKITWGLTEPGEVVCSLLRRAGLSPSITLEQLDEMYGKQEA